MSQISTGTFFSDKEAYETLRRAIYYTNDRVFQHDAQVTSATVNETLPSLWFTG